MEYTRNCPKCNKLIKYIGPNSFREAKRKNTKCKPCSKLGKLNPFYGKKFSEEQLSKWKKERAGKGNPMYGIGGMTGKHQTDNQKSILSEFHNNRWSKIKGVPVDKLRENWTEFKKYRVLVDTLTRQQPIHLLENFDKRGRAGQDGAYHLDHIISVYNGFHNNIPASEIANIDNLQMLPWLENQKKWYK